MTRKTETVAHLDASIARWKTRLRRAINMLGKLEKKRKRLAAKDTAVVGSPARHPEVVVTDADHATQATFDNFTQKIDTPTADAFKAARDAALLADDPDLGIPAFLRRGAAAEVAADVALLDHLAAEEIKADAAATKKAKAAGRIAKMKAKKAGDLKKMPLSGRAALDHIDNG